jgi:hypothetical protein
MRGVSGDCERNASGGPSRTLTVRLDAFALETIEEESRELGVEQEELVAFAVLYYLADLDSGRIARGVGASPFPSTPVPPARPPRGASESGLRRPGGRTGTSPRPGSGPGS